MYGPEMRLHLTRHDKTLVGYQNTLVRNDLFLTKYHLNLTRKGIHLPILQIF